MVNFVKSVGTAILVAQLALGAPQAMKRDSSVGDEVAVSAPDGVPITDTKELASQKSEEASSSTATDYNAYTTANAYESDSTDAVYETASSDAGYDTANVWDTASAAYETTAAYETSAAYETTAAYETSSAAYETTVAYDTDSAAYETSAVYETSSATYETSSVEYTSAATATYGSGSTSWGDSGYNDCVQQCIASFGAPAATYTPPTATESASGESGGSGATHTVIVAPTQGVLRYVPFALNASVGDTVKFMWNANMHTVTKSSQLEVCNKTTSDAFASGVQNQSFVFTQVINSTDPTFFYCAVPTHCQKGMFGIINPPNGDVATSNTTVSAMMPQLINNSSDVAAWNSYTEKTTQGTKAATWGTSIDMASVPGWAHDVFAENVMYTRNFLAMNPDVMKEDGSVDLGASSTPFMIPQDLSSALAASGSASVAPSTTASATGSSAAESGSASAGSSTSGARGLTSSFGLVSIFALGAALFAL